MLIVNADDLGFKEEITDRILKCYHQGRIHSSSTMVFMVDSDRVADLARADQMFPGLHINLDEAFTSSKIAKKLVCHQGMVSDFLKGPKWNQVLYNPFLRNSFEYVFQAQWDEFCRLYGGAPKRLDGHHHMHLCMNMLASSRMQRGIRIRRNFSFFPGEKNVLNRLYRHLVDKWLISRFQCSDYFFSISPIDSSKIQKIVSLSKASDVELMVHPGVDEEYRYLMSDNWAHLMSAHQR